MTRERRGKTAAELMAELDADPAYQARQAEFGREQRERLAAMRTAEEPLITELAAIGLSVDSAWELRSMLPFPVQAFPVLLRHLNLEYPDRVLEGIARCFAVPEARALWSEIVAAYRAADPRKNPGAKEGLAEAVLVTARREVAEDLLDLLRDPTLGDSRILLLRAVTRLRLPDAWAIVEDAARDPVLRQEAEHMLAGRARRLRVKK